MNVVMNGVPDDEQCMHIGVRAWRYSILSTHI